MIYRFKKQKRIIKAEDSCMWIDGEIYVDQSILVRKTMFIVKDIVQEGNVKVITLTYKRK